MNENAIRNAMTTGHKFSSYNSQSQIKEVVRWKICDAIKLRGQGDMDSSMQHTTVTKVAEVIMRDYLSMTDKEFGLVLEMGVSGEFGKDTWVNGGVILQWLRSYQSNAQHIAIIDEQTEEYNSKHRKTRAEVAELNVRSFENSFNSAYEYYKETGTLFAEDCKGGNARAFHMPQWAAMVYDYYKQAGKIPEPSKERLLEAELYADVKVAEHATKAEYVPAAKEDWINCYLLQQYFDDIKNKRL